MTKVISTKYLGIKSFMYFEKKKQFQLIEIEIKTLFKEK